MVFSVSYVVNVKLFTVSIQEHFKGYGAQRYTTTKDASVQADGDETRLDKMKSGNATRADSVAENLNVPVHQDVSKRNNTKVILALCPSHKNCTKLFREEDYQFSRCEWSNCEVTQTTDRIAEASVILFRYDDPYPEWPKIRFANQTYIHRMVERPCKEMWWIAKYDDKINLTWNYRHDADISARIIVIEKASPDEGPYVPRIPLSNKTKSVVWAVSHCNADSRRDEYAAELSKYIDVDIYGKCGTLKCPRDMELECADQWEKEYKFYLAFENAICKDYVTEKLYRTLNRELIPVVMGGADYNKASSPHSCINVFDYSSPKELAGYLHHLAQHEDEYYAYFQWKQRYTFKHSISESCVLCEIANNEKKWARPAYHDYYSWYMNVCHNELVGEMRRKGGW